MLIKSGLTTIISNVSLADGSTTSITYNVISASYARFEVNISSITLNTGDSITVDVFSSVDGTNFSSVNEDSDQIVFETTGTAMSFIDTVYVDCRALKYLKVKVDISGSSGTAEGVVTVKASKTIVY